MSTRDRNPPETPEGAAVPRHSYLKRRRAARTEGTGPGSCRAVRRLSVALAASRRIRAASARYQRGSRALRIRPVLNRGRLLSIRVQRSNYPRSVNGGARAALQSGSTEGQ